MNYMKRVLAVTLTVLMLTSMLTGCSSKVSQTGSPKKGQQIATMTIKGYGDIKIMLFAKQAPKAVENFVTHAEKGYYNGLSFHRIMNDFMMQGGDPQGTGAGGESIWGKPFEDEFSELRNFYGALSMANSGPNTNGSQFFIVNKKTAVTKEEVDGIRAQMGLETIKYTKADYDNYAKLGGTPWLDRMHTVFGQVIEGMDIVDKIATVPVDEQSMPTTPVLIETIKITKN